MHAHALSGRPAAACRRPPSSPRGPAPRPCLSFVVLPRPFVTGEEKLFSSLLPRKKRPGNEAIVCSAENRSRGELCRLNIVICLMCMLLASPECIWARPPSFAQKMCNFVRGGEYMVGRFIAGKSRVLYTYGKNFNFL